MIKLPYVAYDTWKETRTTLHLIFQIMGKIRLKSTPRKNHWWYTTLYVSSEGFTTHAIPYDKGISTFEITLSVVGEALIFRNSKGSYKEIPLKDGYAISACYHDMLHVLNEWGIRPELIDRPYDMGIDEPFGQLTGYHHYDWAAIRQFWQMMTWVDGVFKEFSGRFYGKTCPVQLYWHHMDLAVTRFSGKPAPPMDPKARISDKDAYSHEVISFGFWAGDETLPEPAFYSYTAPSPDGLDQQPLQPDQAFWTDANGSPMAILTYNTLLNKSDPRATLLAFLESAYTAGAQLVNWDLEAFKVPPLDDM